mmetsp:Transcript_11178/g.22434  ORF Transcript_11178/g.22434 Transcript_11178/m.22434 type:complete len:241 (-) Transcript_11178:1091-1813(-)
MCHGLSSTATKSHCHSFSSSSCTTLLQLQQYRIFLTPQKTIFVSCKHSCLFSLDPSHHSHIMATLCSKDLTSGRHCCPNPDMCPPPRRAYCRDGGAPRQHPTSHQPPSPPQWAPSLFGNYAPKGKCCAHRNDDALPLHPPSHQSPPPRRWAPSSLARNVPQGKGCAEELDTSSFHRCPNPPPLRPHRHPRDKHRAWMQETNPSPPPTPGPRPRPPPSHPTAHPSAQQPLHRDHAGPPAQR